MHQVRLHRVEAHVRADRDGVRLVALEGFLGIVLGGGADVAALGVEDDGDAGIGLVDVRDQLLELVFGALRGEIGDLGLERADQVGGGVDDGAAEREDRPARGGQRRRQARRVRVQPHAQQGIVALPGGGQLFGESHGVGK